MSHRSKLSLIIGADVVAWVVVGVMLYANPGPTSLGRLPFFVVLEVAILLLGLAVLPWLFGEVLADLFEKYVKDYFGAYVAGYLGAEAAHTGHDPKGPNLVLVPDALGKGGGGFLGDVSAAR